MADNYRVTEIRGRRQSRVAYSGPDYRAAGAVEDRLLADGKNTRVAKGDQVLSERSAQPKRRWSR